MKRRKIRAIAAAVDQAIVIFLALSLMLILAMAIALYLDTAAEAYAFFADAYAFFGNQEHLGYLLVGATFFVLGAQPLFEALKRLLRRRSR